MGGPGAVHCGAVAHARAEYASLCRRASCACARARAQAFVVTLVFFLPGLQVCCAVMRAHGWPPGFTAPVARAAGCDSCWLWLAAGRPHCTVAASRAVGPSCSGVCARVRSTHTNCLVAHQALCACRRGCLIACCAVTARPASASCAARPYLALTTTACGACWVVSAMLCVW